MLDPGAQAGEARPSRIGYSLAASACLGVQMPAAMRAKPLAIFPAKRLGWKRQENLLAQNVLQQDTIFLIITDFGLRSGNRMPPKPRHPLQSGEKSRSNCPESGCSTGSRHLAQSTSNRPIYAARTRMSSTNSPVRDVPQSRRPRRPRPAGPSGEYRNRTRWSRVQRQDETGSVPFQIYNCNQHGNFQQERRTTQALSRPNPTPQDYHSASGVRTPCLEVLDSFGPVGRALMSPMENDG